MELKVWMNWYGKILKDFGFDRKKDEKSAEYLNKILRKKKLISITDLPSGKNFIILGAGPSLKKHIKLIKKIYSDDFIIIAADGATTALIEENIIPHIIVTDLDGNVDDIINASLKDAYIVLHAHGNNLDKILVYAPKLEKVMGTTQSTPFEYVYNFGGFTDGDRAVFLAVELGAKKIILAGMDFGKVISKYSRPDLKEEVGMADTIKILKLEYAEKLIQWIEKNESVDIYNLTFLKNQEKVFRKLLR